MTSHTKIRWDLPTQKSGEIPVYLEKTNFKKEKVSDIPVIKKLILIPVELLYLPESSENSKPYDFENDVS